jgi:hypothetical protein
MITLSNTLQTMRRHFRLSKGLDMLLQRQEPNSDRF